LPQIALNVHRLSLQRWAHAQTIRRAGWDKLRLFPSLSGERVPQELVKLIETPDPIAVLQMMQKTGVLAVVLPEARRLDRLRQLIAFEPGVDPFRRLAALIEVDGEGAMALAASALSECVARSASWRLSPGLSTRKRMHDPSVERFIGLAWHAIATWRYR